ncbi:hypothetical protein CCASP_03720 [Corynebacterium caspium DSM 44850]|nr:hypothetical protein CCASP_03720 [Corynebacterium caspium DSM 44850]
MKIGAYFIFSVGLISGLSATSLTSAMYRIALAALNILGGGLTGPALVSLICLCTMKIQTRINARQYQPGLFFTALIALGKGSMSGYVAQSSLSKLWPAWF